MPRLPVVSGADVVKALAKIGFFIDHQTGSHLIMRLEREKVSTVTVPQHRELKKGTLRAIIRQSGLTVKEFEDLLRAPAFVYSSVKVREYLSSRKRSLEVS